MRKKTRRDLRKKLLVLSVLSGTALIVMVFYLFFGAVTAKDGATLVFASADGLLITADSYIEHEITTTPFIVMFHQANWSRGEFLETAPRFNQLGYNCLAVDLRSGDTVRGVQNKTARRARELGKQVRHLDAMQDMMAALKHVKRKYNPPALLALGSSYSASLALKIAGDNPGLLDGVLAFSPAEYFENDDLPLNWIEESAKTISIPVFITSARKEKSRWEDIFDAIDTKTKLSYLPLSSGKHGSRALWERYPDSEGYWTVIDTFLKSYF